MTRGKSILVAAIALATVAWWTVGNPQLSVASEAGADLFATAGAGGSSIIRDSARAEADFGYDAYSGAKSTHSPFILSEPKSIPPFPILLNQSVQRYLHDYLSNSDQLEESFDRGRPYLPEMARVLRANGVPDDLVYLAFAESAFSKRGKGPWQFTTDTAKRFGLHINSYVDERRDPILSTRAAAEYLAELHDAAGYDWRVALVGWNGGDHAIDRYWSLRGTNYNRYLSLLPGRTRSLLGRFMAVDFIAHNSAAYGIGQVNFNEPPPYEIVKVKGGTPLSRLARTRHTTETKLHNLNPALLKDKVPPYARVYPVRVPLVRSAHVSF
jgi:peptidoglycan lytic transglycosylase D